MQNINKGKQFANKLGDFINNYDRYKTDLKAGKIATDHDANDLDDTFSTWCSSLDLAAKFAYLLLKTKKMDFQLLSDLEWKLSHVLDDYSGSFDALKLVDNADDIINAIRKIKIA